MSYRFRRSEVRQEEDTVPWGLVGYAFFLMVVLSLALIACAHSLMKAREGELRPSGAFPEKHLSPRREVARVEQELYGEQGKGQALEAKERRALEHYHWVDKDRGLVSIPIDQAMDLVLEERPR